MVRWLESSKYSRANFIRIFIIEGLITLFFSIFVFIFVPHFPAKDSWLKEEDRQMLLARLEVDKGREREDVSTGSWKKVVFDYRIWLLYASHVPSSSNSNTLS
ncbi:MAG: hypothetical protein CL912_01770 [Deltaproteobacteria bacterium]|nr:hypothetical protein [Deltaproteobacteria bacterium]|tara:strand:- start:614 stop:922 length:309 start_codon:yes stop_codon:yes gene_type:complete